MFGVDWPIWVGVALVTGWRVLRKVKPSWAKQVKVIEKVGRELFYNTVPLARVVGLDDVAEKAAFLQRGEMELNARGLPTTTKAMETLEKVYLDELRNRSAADLVDQITGKKLFGRPPSMRG